MPFATRMMWLGATMMQTPAATSLADRANSRISNCYGSGEERVEVGIYPRHGQWDSHVFEGTVICFQMLVDRCYNDQHLQHRAEIVLQGYQSSGMSRCSTYDLL